jgi:AraC-like DNA-binding protein
VVSAALHDSVEGDDGCEGFILLRRAPSPALTGLVSGLAGYREMERRPIRMTETASLIVPLVISFGEPFEIGLGREPDDGDRYASFTAGLYGGPVQIRSHGGSHCLQVNFTPLGAYRFFGRPMDEVAGRMVRLDDLEDADLALLRQRLGEERSWSSRFAIAESFVRDRLAGGRAGSPATAWAYRRIIDSGGSVRVEALAARLECSRKHLAARFREEIGVGAKTVARIVRFNRAQALAGSGSEGGWADIAAACGYADQAHLVRDFAEFAATTPAAWRNGA